MQTFVVLYRPSDLLLDAINPPKAFKVTGDDSDHAEEQCIVTFPGCRVAWVWEGDNVQDAYNDYFTTSNCD